MQRLIDMSFFGENDSDKGISRCRGVVAVGGSILLVRTNTQCRVVNAESPRMPRAGGADSTRRWKRSIVGRDAAAAAWRQRSLVKSSINRWRPP